MEHFQGHNGVFHRAGWWRSSLITFVKHKNCSPPPPPPPPPSPSPSPQVLKEDMRMAASHGNASLFISIKNFFAKLFKKVLPYIAPYITIIIITLTAAALGGPRRQRLHHAARVPIHHERTSGKRRCRTRSNGQVKSHVTRRTSHVTRHTSHVARHTSHVTRHTSHVTRHTSQATRVYGLCLLTNSPSACRAALKFYHLLRCQCIPITPTTTTTTTTTIFSITCGPSILDSMWRVCILSREFCFK